MSDKRFRPKIFIGSSHFMNPDGRRILTREQPDADLLALVCIQIDPAACVDRCVCVSDGGAFSTPTEATVTWLLTPGEAALFEGWFEYVLQSGTLTFECPLLTPLGFENYKANFADIYEGPILVGVDLWRFNAKLRLIKRPLLDKEWVVGAPDYILDADIFDRAMNQKWPGQTE